MTDSGVTLITEVPRLPGRARDSHKGTFGKVLVVGGSRGMSGAAVLCGRAALRGGAGLVQVACPACVQDVVASGHPGYTTFGIRQHSDGAFSEGAADDRRAGASDRHDPGRPCCPLASRRTPQSRRSAPANGGHPQRQWGCHCCKSH